MKISPNSLYNSKEEAEEEIKNFKMFYPKSIKKFKIKKFIAYQIEEVKI